MRRLLLVIGVSPLLVGCFQVPAVPTPPPTTMSTWGPYGGFTMSSGANCAGQTALVNGKTIVSNPCFTGSDNVVLCTDITAPNAVACSPTVGQVAIAGFGFDQVAYARVR